MLASAMRPTYLLFELTSFLIEDTSAVPQTGEIQILFGFGLSYSDAQQSRVFRPVGRAETSRYPYDAVKGNQLFSAIAPGSGERTDLISIPPLANSFQILVRIVFNDGPSGTLWLPELKDGSLSTQYITDTTLKGWTSLVFHLDNHTKRPDNGNANNFLSGDLTAKYTYLM